MSLVSEKLQKLAAYDPDINVCGIHLDANESFLELSDALKTQIARRVAAVSYNRYPDPLASGVCGAFGARYDIDSRYVTAGNGSDELISIIINTFTQRADKVLITEPDFSMYKIYCAISEVEPVILGKQGDLGFDPAEMIQLAKSEKVSLVLFSNPCNPTGQGISADEVLKIADSVDCLVVVDEAYMDFWDQSVLGEVLHRENLMVLKTCSKIGFAAARLGFAVANGQLTDYLRAAKSPYNVNLLTQIAGEVLLGDPDYLPTAVSTIKAARDWLEVQLKRLEKEYPQSLLIFATHANFVTVQVKNALALHGMLKERGISVRLLAGRYFRITAGTPEENETLIKTFETILKETQ